MVIEPQGRPLQIWAELGFVIGDLPAIKNMLACKGYAGRRPCFACENIVSKLHARSHPWGEELSLASTDFGRMRQCTDAGIRATYRRLDAAKANGASCTALESLETDLGWTWSPQPLVMDVSIFKGAISSVMFDWCHVYVVGGTVGSGR